MSNKTKLTAVSFLILFLVAVFVPFFASAVSTPAPAAGGSATQKTDDIFTKGIVPCAGLDCSACDIFKLIWNLLNVIWKGSWIIATGMFMYGGFLFLKNDPAKGKKVLTNTVIGVAIAFVAWVAIDTTIKVITNQGLGKGSAQIAKYGPWNEIKCAVQSSGINTAGSFKAGQVGPPPGVAVIDYSGETLSDINARTLLDSYGVAINHYKCGVRPSECTLEAVKALQGCQVDSPPACTNLEGIRKDTIYSVRDLKRQCGCQVVVTGGTEPGHEGGAMSHGTGYKIDVRSTADIDKYIITTFKQIGTRDDGATLYSDGRKCTIYADERHEAGVSPHWDILVKPSPPGIPGGNPYPPCT